VKKAGNVKAITLPNGLIEEPEVPISTDITSLVVDGNNINLTWNRIDLTSLEGYKVVYSFTDTTPVYGESGTYYSHWITDSYTTSATITLDSIIGNNTGNSTELYISITALYDNHNTKKPGNVKTISLN
jgi:hypothetical protein